MTIVAQAFLVLALVLAAALAIVSARAARTRQKLRAMGQRDAKAVLRQRPGVDELRNTAPPAVLDALRRGRKIEAIKLYREAAGVGLKEAKDYVEAIERR